MIDASSKSNPGVHKFGLTNTGNEEQCLSVNRGNVRGSVSMIRISAPGGEVTEKLNQPTPIIYHKFKKSNALIVEVVKITFTICHPHACAESDLASLIENHFDHRIDYKIENTNRSLKQTPTKIQIFSLIAIGTLIIFTLASTLKVNVIPKLPLGHAHFDIVGNIGTVWRRYINEDSSETPTDFLNGWKTLYLFMAVLLHQLMIFETSTHGLNITLEEYTKNFHFVADPLSRIVIDLMCQNVAITAIVGAIASRSFIDGAKSGPKLFLSMTLLRFLRLFPIVSFFVMVVIISPLIRLSNSGIYMNSVTQSMSDRCSTYGWLDVLFIGNFIPITNICLIVGWFLSADFQLNIISFPLLITLVRDLRKGVKLLILYILIGIAVEYSVHIYMDVNIIPRFRDSSTYETIPINHFWTTNYVSTYAIGLTFGMLISRNVRIPDYVYKRAYIYIYLACLFVLTLTVILTLNIDEWTYDRKFTNFIASVIRTISTLCTATVVYMIWMSDTNLIKRILTISPLMNSASKIILPSFLAHSLALTWLAAFVQNDPIEYNWMYFLSRVMIVYPLSIIIGLILHILIEIPFMKIMKSVFMKKKE